MNRALFSIIIILLFIYLPQVHSQSDYGKVTKEELAMTTYPQDTTAAAVILLKDGNVRFVYNELYGFQYEYTVAMKIKILKTEGLDECNRQIYYTRIKTGSEEKIQSLSGTTYNIENGKIVKTKLSKENIFDNSENEKLNLRKFTMPAAKVGSVIEFKYTIVSDFYYEFRDFEFQDHIPTAYVSFEAKLPEWFAYNVNAQGYECPIPKVEPANETFIIRYNGGIENLSCLAQKYIYKGKNLSALKKEVFVWTIDDYKSKISFELQSFRPPYGMIKNYTARWSNIDKNLLENSAYGGNTKKGGLFKEIGKKELTIETAREIQNMVKQQVKWNNNTKLFPADNLKECLKSGLGNSADINFLLINALKSAGFEAYPVMLSTRKNGRIPIANPSLSALNATITALRIDTVIHYTDASAKYGDWDILPENDMVPQARILEPSGGHWVDLSKISAGTEFVSAEYSFADDKYQGKIMVERKDNDAYNFRLQQFTQNKDREDYVTKLANRLSLKISDHNIEGISDTDKSLKELYTIHQDITLGEDFIYLNPMLIRPLASNPFKDEKRVFPVQFDYPKKYIQVVNITIPEGYVIDELPTSEKYVFGQNNQIIFQYRVAQSDNRVSLHYQLQLRELLFLPTEYENLRDFFGKVVAKSSEQIVLKKAAS